MKRSRKSAPVRRLPRLPLPSLRMILYGLTALGLGVTAAAAWSLWHDAARWPVQRVEVMAAPQHTRIAALRSAMMAELERGFLALDLDALTQTVDALPWVAAVRITRVWPDTLRLSLREHEAYARWGNRALVNTDGVRFVPQDMQDFEALPRLAGPIGAETRLVAQHREYQALLKPTGRHIGVLTEDDTGGLSLTLNTGTVIVLGRVAQSERLSRFVHAYADWRGRHSEPARVDLRYPHGFAARRVVAADTRQGG